MRVLVTGGAGYVGSHTVRALREAGHEVTVVDNLSTGHKAAVKGVRLDVADIRDGEKMLQIMKRDKIEAVMHFAALALVEESQKKPLEYWDVNVGGTRAVAEAAVRAGCRTFVFSSSAAVYGAPPQMRLEYLMLLDDKVIERVLKNWDAKQLDLATYVAEPWVKDKIFKRLRKKRLGVLDSARAWRGGPPLDKIKGAEEALMAAFSGETAAAETKLEECSHSQPASTYGVTKAAAEELLHECANTAPLRVFLLRYFNAAGADPSGDLGEAHVVESHAIPRALIASATSSEFTIFGTDYPTPDGTAIRDYVHVSDLASAHVLAATKLTRAEAYLSARDSLNPEEMEFLWSFNLGRGSGSSVRELVGAVETVTGKKLRTQLAPRRYGDPPTLVADATRIQRSLGWTPKFTTLESIVETAWNWHQKHPKGYEK